MAGERAGGLRSALVMVSHDRRFLTNLSRNDGLARPRPDAAARPGFAEFEAWRDQVLEEEERERHKLDRQDRPRGGLGPLRRDGHVASATCAAWGISRPAPRRGATSAITQRRQRQDDAVSEGKTSGKLVDRGRGASRRAYGDRPIVREFSTRVLRGDRLGVVGAERRRQDDAAERLLTGTGLPPDSGTVRLGANVAKWRRSTRAATSLQARLDDAGRCA